MCIQNEATIRTGTNTYSLLLLKFSVQTSARRRTRSGGPRTARTGAERRHRTFEPRPTLEKKNDTDLVSFFFPSARRGSNPQSIFDRNAENTGNADKHWGCNNVRNVLCAIKIHYLHGFYNAMHHECNMKCNMDGYVVIWCSSINFINSF